MKRWERMLFVHCRPLLAQPSRNSLLSLACPLRILIFLSAWFFWESFACGRAILDDMERSLCSWGAMVPRCCTLQRMRTVLLRAEICAKRTLCPGASGDEAEGGDKGHPASQWQRLSPFTHLLQTPQRLFDFAKHDPRLGKCSPHSGLLGSMPSSGRGR